MPAVAFTYDGAAIITAVVSGATVGRTYSLYAGASSDSQVATTSTVSLSITDIAGFTVGQNFPVTVEDTSVGGDYIDVFLATYGTPGANDQAGYPITWNHLTGDVSVTFTAAAGVTYGLGVRDRSDVFGGPYTAGTSHTLTNPGATGSEVLYVYVYDIVSDEFFAWVLLAPGSNVPIFQTVTVGGPPPQMAYWLVDHYEHEFTPVVVGAPAIEDNGTLIETVHPENLHFVLRLEKMGPPDIDYEVSNTALNTSDAAAVSADYIGPFRTDFRLRRSDLEEPILGGMHTQLQGADGEAPNQHSAIAGKGYVHYLEHRFWPYDATLSYVNWPSGFRFKVTAAEVGQIVKDILETIRDVSPNFPAAPDAGNPSYSLGFTVDADSTGHNINYSIEAFDSRSAYQIVQELSQLDELQGGFDFYITWDKVFTLVAPKIGNPASTIFTLEVDATSHEANMAEVGFTNTGPEASHVLGVGAGTSTRQGGVNKHLPSVSARYRRLDNVADFGDVKNLDALESLTSESLFQGASPVHEIPITVNPADIPGFWTITRPGEYIQVNYDLGWHEINSVQRIVEMDCTVDLEGNERVTLGLNQYYPQNTDDGIADW